MVICTIKVPFCDVCFFVINPHISGDFLVVEFRRLFRQFIVFTLNYAMQSFLPENTGKESGLWSQHLPRFPGPESKSTQTGRTVPLSQAGWKSGSYFLPDRWKSLSSRLRNG